MRIPTYIVGAGGLGRGILETINTISDRDRNWEVKGFIDDNAEIHHKSINGVDVLGGIDSLLTIESFANVILAIANPNVKATVYERLKKNGNIMFPNIIHPTVQLSHSAAIGCGNIISKNVSFSADVEIGNFTLIHFNSSVGHDVQLEDYVTVYPGVNLSGFSKMRMKCQIGTNAAILPQIIVGEEAVVGAGSLVNTDVRSRRTVVGVPATEIN